MSDTSGDQHAQSWVDRGPDTGAGIQGKQNGGMLAPTFYTDALHFSGEVIDAVAKPLDSLSAFCDTLRTSDLRVLMTSVIEEMRALNEPTAESIQLLLIDDIKASLANGSNPNAESKPSLDIGRHAVDLITTLTDAYFTEADDLADNVAQFSPDIQAALDAASKRASRHASILAELNTFQDSQSATPSTMDQVKRWQLAVSQTLPTKSEAKSVSDTLMRALKEPIQPSDEAQPNTHVRKEISAGHRHTSKATNPEGMWQLGWVEYDERME